MSKHMPTPWRVDEDYEHISDCNGDTIAYLNDFQTDADPEFIVRACNAHEELVEALEEIKAGHQLPRTRAARALAALATARGAGSEEGETSD